MKIEPVKDSNTRRGLKKGAKTRESIRLGRLRLTVKEAGKEA